MKPTNTIAKLFSSVSTLAVVAGAMALNGMAWGEGVLAWGVGTTNTSNFPEFGQSIVPTAALNGVTAIAGGYLHTIALKGGAVLAWGDNSQNQCNITDFANSGVSAVAGGLFHTTALKDGAVLAWGRSDSGQCTIPASASSGVSAIANGWYHTIALKGGAVLAWGDNNNGQCNVLGQCDVPVDAQMKEPTPPHTRDSVVKINGLSGPAIKGLQVGMNSSEAKACMASLVGNSVVTRESNEIWGDEKLNERVTRWDFFIEKNKLCAYIFENPAHKVIEFQFTVDFVDVIFNATGLSDKDFLQKFMAAYKIPELTTNTRSNEDFTFTVYIYRDPKGCEIKLHFLSHNGGHFPTKRSLIVGGTVSDKELKFD